MERNFYEINKDDDVIAYDGLGPIEYSDPAFETYKMPTLRLPDGLDWVRLKPTNTPPMIPVRKGVKPFDVYYSQFKGLFVFKQALLEEFTDSIIDPMLLFLRINGKEHPYIFAKLKMHTMLPYIDFNRSIFDIYPNDKLRINGTRIGRGEVPYDTGFNPVQEGVRFDNLEDYLVRERVTAVKKLQTTYPRILALDLEHVPKFFGVDGSITIFNEKFALEARKKKNTGMWFPGPVVHVVWG